MAGAFLEVKVDDLAVRQALDRLIRAGGQLQPVFRDIGEHLLISHRERFEQQIDPAGEPWEPLDSKYRARKKKNEDKILVLEGDLFGQLNFDARRTQLEFGSNRIYAATHQFGAQDRGIPDRPFLGISADDEREILNIIEDHITRALKG